MSTEEERLPTSDLVDAVETALQARGVAWRSPHAGLSDAQRFVVTLPDGSSVFVKAAVDDQTQQWLETELAAMSAARDFAPEVIAVTAAAGRPVLVTESLHDRAYWPAGVFETPGGGGQEVLWKPGHVERLFDALDRLAKVTPPPVLPPLESVYRPQWELISEEPDRFHALGLAGPGWLDSALPELVAAEKALDLRGATFVHGDVRSDNVCFLEDKVVLVDWSDASRGAGGFDLANLVQGLPLEGGPDPQDVLPDAAPFAAWRAGEMVNRAAEPAPSWLVNVFKRLALINLHWVSAARGLPVADLRDWRSI
ncbi:phosphotransferase [Kribbella yunnanensis]